VCVFAIVNTSSPSNSLLLSKTVKGFTHAGGWLRIKEGADYKAIRQWIVEGAGNSETILKEEVFV